MQIIGFSYSQNINIKGSISLISNTLNNFKLLIGLYLALKLL